MNVHFADLQHAVYTGNCDVIRMSTILPVLFICETILNGWPNLIDILLS